SLRVLDGEGRGRVSNIIAAVGYVQKVNEHGRWSHIDGVNLSVGYEYEAEWFGCGQSPLCQEVDRLVRAGTVVVTAAGNTGYGIAQAAVGDFKTGLDVTINDPGNTALAITVGSTHRDKPHLYGVSYFSSKGPTADGRLKPDLVAPGEKIISCSAGLKKAAIEHQAKAELEACGVRESDYREESGTSMAAPHVSGAIAAFLSIRREFIGQPERVKEIFTSTATDLGRERYFQGHGLIDLMRAIQSV
ncbi:MAG: S8 family serine peptidase, partial [Thermoanaerobaculia bacterium]|nr:S8 family serine peptidase [Thermoanaerobaculia bacterium]